MSKAPTQREIACVAAGLYATASVLDQGEHKARAMAVAEALCWASGVYLEMEAENKFAVVSEHLRKIGECCETSMNNAITNAIRRQAESN